MIHVRKSKDRGHFDHGWLKTYHTFSFADYHDPNHMGFRVLRVINEDRVQAGEGFGTHPHRDMEIITYVMSGALAHRDSMGNGSTIQPGDVQYMSAGSGVTHSEYNHSDSETTHLLQIWILPDEKGAKPRYDQQSIRKSDKLGQLKLLASKDGQGHSIRVRQDMRLYASILRPKTAVTAELATGRHAWIQVIRGQLSVNQQILDEGDGAAVSEESRLTLEAGEIESEFLLFDLP